MHGLSVDVGQRVSPAGVESVGRTLEPVSATPGAHENERFVYTFHELMGSGTVATRRTVKVQRVD